MGPPSAVAVALVAATLQYAVAERFGRRAWRLVLGYHAEQGPYREANIVVRHGDRAPRAVRFTAFTCLLFGQMFVPGAYAVYGLCTFSLGGPRPNWLGAFLGFAGLIVAGALWATGYGLLLRLGRRRILARFAKRAAIALNAAILPGYALYVCRGMPSDVQDMVEPYVGSEVMTFTLAYALLSLAQAALLAHALSVEAQEPLARAPVAPELPRWLLRLLRRKRSRAAK
jgi:hypothetical protein